MDDFTQLQRRAMGIRQRYNEVNAQDGHKPWGALAYTAGLVGDVGDLTKIVMALQNYRSMSEAETKLKHELGDCLWSLFVIAEAHDVSLKNAILSTMNELEERLK